jgi:hypothetical protein
LAVLFGATAALFRLISRTWGLVFEGTGKAIDVMFSYIMRTSRKLTGMKSISSALSRIRKEYCPARNMHIYAARTKDRGDFQGVISKFHPAFVRFLMRSLNVLV